MFFMYILKSSKDKDLYIGSTSDLRKRLKEHNSGQVYSTKDRRPFKIAYYEAYAAESEARQREHNLKLHGRARMQLFKRIKESLKT